MGIDCPTIFFSIDFQRLVLCTHCIEFHCNLQNIPLLVWPRIPHSTRIHSVETSATQFLSGVRIGAIDMHILLCYHAAEMDNWNSYCHVEGCNIGTYSSRAGSFFHICICDHYLLTTAIGWEVREKGRYHSCTIDASIPVLEINVNSSTVRLQLHFIWTNWTWTVKESALGRRRIDESIVEQQPRPVPWNTEAGKWKF